MLRRMARRVQQVRNDITERQAVAIVDRTHWKSYIRPGMQDIFGAGLAGKRPPGRTMIGMDMSIDDEVDAHANLVGASQIRCDVADRVHDCTRGMSAAAEQIGDRNRIGMEELTQDHACLPQRPAVP